MTGSAHYELYGCLLFAFLSALPLLIPVLLGLRWLRARRHAHGRKALRRLVWGSVSAAVVYAAVIADALLIEPNWPQLRVVKIGGDVESELRVLHMSDLHLEQDMTRRDRWLVEVVQQLSPDMICITGDIQQMDNYDVASLHRVLRHIKAPLGVFACAGYDDLTLLRRASEDIVYLDNEAAVVHHQTDVIAVVGTPRIPQEELKRLLAGSNYAIVLEHTPDRTRRAAGTSADLYLCGHTHGGQVRIPFWGAIITNSASGKKYEAGLCREGKMFIHTSRGLGLEPRPAPQVRFLCRPEITLIRIVPRRT